jgi:methylated-DNA-[protein]-cysteine S-methyltransferase
MRRCVKKVATPIGELTLVAEEGALVAVHWEGEAGPGEAGADDAVLVEAAGQLGDYFAGCRRTFDVKLRPHGTVFQRRVWEALGQIPHGDTHTYAALARAIGRPTASRAVGAANGRNPLPIFIPCHRVVGAGGALTGFSGGLEIKRRLLALEAAHQRAGGAGIVAEVRRGA